MIASGSQIGPSTGSFALGAGVTGSSLTSVGTLTSLNVTGATSVQPSSTLSTSSTPYGISIQNTSTKTYPSTSSFISLPGLYQNLELGTSQTIDTVTPGGFNFTYGIYNNLTKSAGTTSDIERLYFNGFYQSFTWSDLNTCKQYNGFADFFSYQGIDANGRTSSALTAKNISLVPPNGGTQTISSVTAESGIIYNSQGTTTINVTTSTNLVPSLRITNSNTGTKTVNITTHTFFGTNTSWGTAGGVGTLNATITNLYGLRLTAPASTTGLTVTNKWGISQEWADANNYFAGNIQMGAGKGIDFSANANAAGMTSELLDDYEQGTFTPTLSFGGNSVGITYAARTCQYIKIGKSVLVNVYIFLSNKGTSTGAAVINGFPFVQNNQDFFIPLGVRGGINSGGNQVSLYSSVSGGSSFTLYSCNLTGGSNQVLLDTAFSNATELNFNFWYQTTW